VRRNKVVSYLWYTGCGANPSGKEAGDPTRTSPAFDAWPLAGGKGVRNCRPQARSKVLG